MEGSVMSGRYALEDRLGSGGMSTVYRATDQVLERTVAVKVLAEHLSDDDKFVARFRREALAVAKLVHPNIVQVYDTGVDAGRHYIVMEYVEGRSGAQLLQRQGRLDPATAVEIGAQSTAGLEYAHRQGIVHRDVKPGNLMIIGGPAAGDGSGNGETTVKLTDFGIARAAEQTRLTQVGSVVGTAAYLAPEQARGDEATPVADVYALGVVIYQLLTGRLPYEGSSLAELAIRRESERPLPPSSYEDSVPETLSAAVLRALESDPAARYANARTMGAALRMGLAGEDVSGLDDAAPTRAMTGAPVTEPTRHLGGTDQPATPVAERPPVPPRRPPSARPAAHRSTLSRVARTIGALMVIALIAAVVVGLVLLATDAGQETDVGEVISTELEDQITKLEDFIEANTE